MNIQVYPHRIILNKTNEVNSGEYNVNECTFEFSQEYEGLTKVAVFSLCDGTTKNVTILNNQCIIPVECLQETGQVQIGVYGYATQDNELVLRYSPTPQNFVVRLGSYKEGTQPVAPTPTDWEILVEQVSDIAEDVSSIHEDITGINGEISGINIDIRDLQDTKANISDLAEVAFTGEFSDLKNIPSYATTQQLNQEIQDRQDADVNLQSQIDAISVSSDVVDVVGTYQELLDYDTTHLKDNDIVKVLQDSTHSDALSYYRWDKETSTWSYVGSEGPFYTKSETDALLNDKQDVIDIDNMLSSDFVDDTNSTNKFVTQADITNWNNKEDKSNKVTEINSSSTDTQYPSAKCVYNSQEEQNEQLAELEMLYNAFPTVSDEDTTIQLDNTAKVKFREIDLKGNTSQVVIPEEQGTSVSNTSIYVSDVNTDKESSIEMSGNTYQETTTGKNLLNTNNVEIGTKNGITTAYNSATQEIIFNGTCNTDNTQIVVSTNIIPFISGTTKVIGYYVGGSLTNSGVFRTFSSGWTNYDGVNIYQLNSSNPIIVRTTTFNADKNLFSFRFDNGAVATNFTIKLMITDSDNTDFEKFTYGASPNPSYPQNIEVVTGTQNVNVCGKNLFDKSNVNKVSGYFNTQNISIRSADTTKTLYIPCNSNTTYTIQKTLSQRFVVGYTKVIPTISTDVYSITSNNSGTSITITTEDDAKYLVVFYYKSDADTLTEQQILDSIQIEQGSTATTYEQYQGTTYPVNLGNIELCKIDTYQDRIYKQNDKWYLEKNCGSSIFGNNTQVNGVSDTQSQPSIVSLNGTYAIIKNTLNSNIKNDTMYCIIAKYEYNSIITDNKKAQDNLNDNTFCMRQGTNDRIYFKNSVFTGKTGTEIKELIKGEKLYYVLATPTTTEITDTNLVNQLNALYNATIYPITNINTDTSNLLPYIDLHYNFVTPSPSPSRPSQVNLVKGNNTITISNSDNTESQVFPINLGNIELCKIGTYQDYIYESNGNWFKKSNIGKIALNGSEENWARGTIQDYYRYTLSLDTLVSADAVLIYSNYYRGITYNNRNSDYFNTIYANGNIGINTNVASTLTEWKSWLSNNNLIAYYVLVTPTDTQITDTTLITQLNNIKKAYSYDIQTNISQTNADKQFIIYAEAIRSLKDVFE